MAKDSALPPDPQHFRGLARRFELQVFAISGSIVSDHESVFNEAHLTLLEDFVTARLRERGWARKRMTLVARLPRWLKSAKNRDEVLRLITRLRRSRDVPAC